MGLNDGRFSRGFDLFLRNAYVLVLDVETEAIEEAHVDVGDPDQGELGEHVAAPSCVQQLKVREDEEECSDVMAEAVLAGEEVEEFADVKGSLLLTLFLAELARLAEDLLVGHGPRGASDGQGEKQKKHKLVRKGDGENARLHNWVGCRSSSRARRKSLLALCRQDGFFYGGDSRGGGLLGEGQGATGQDAKEQGREGRRG